MRRLIGCVAAGGVVLSLTVFAAPGTPVSAFDGEMTWVAGAGDGEGAPGTDVPFDLPVDVAIDVDGSVLVAERDANRVRRINADGTLATVASVLIPQSVVADAGAIYATNNQLIVRIDRASGSKQVFAGTGVRQFNGGGPATERSLGTPVGMAIDGAGALLVAEQWNSRIRRIVGGGMTTIAGTGATAYGGDGGSALDAYLNQPYDVTVGPGGVVFFADTENHRIRKIDGAGIISTVVGNGTGAYAGDGGAAIGASLRRPTSLAFDAAGNLFISDTGNDAIRRVDTGGVITTVAGTGIGGFAGDGAAAVAAQLDAPRGLAIDGLGRVVVADAANNRVRRFTVGGAIETIGGNGLQYYGVTNGVARESGIADNAALGLDREGRLLIGDSGMLRRLDGQGGISRIGGIGDPFGNSGDGGPATAAGITTSAVVGDVAGNVYIADRTHAVIRRVDPNGIITTIAGTGVAGHSGDGGPATSAQFAALSGLAVDSIGNLYVADDSWVRKIDLNGIITTIAGTAVATPASGDGGPATSAQLSAWDVDVDASGNLYVADASNGDVRKIAADGTITTIYKGTRPSGVAVDAAGNVYVAARDLVQIDPTGAVRTIAVSGSAGPDLTTGGSPASAVQAGIMYGVAVAANGDVYVISHYGTIDIGATSPSWVYRIDNAAAADLRTYVPTTPAPVRIVDTRNGIGAATAPLAPGQELVVPLAGHHGVEPDAVAAVLNVTATRTAADGYVTVYPCGTPPSPITSNLNQVAGRDVANSTIARLGNGGAVCITTSSTTDIVIDLQGWHPASTDYKPTTPIRVADTRIGHGITTRLEPFRVAALPIAGANGIAPDATAIAMNVTVADSSDQGYITSFPCGTEPPVASNLNLWPGHPIANFAITKLTDGAVCFVSNVATDLIVDIQGWYPLATTYRALDPVRVIDTRQPGQNPPPPNTPLVVQISGRTDLPDLGDATTVAVNVTTVDAPEAGYVTVYPCAQPQPYVSNNNTSPDRNVATLAIVPVGPDGTICITTSITVDLIVDIQGWHREGR